MPVIVSLGTESPGPYSTIAFNPVPPMNTVRSVPRSTPVGDCRRRYGAGVPAGARGVDGDGAELAETDPQARAKVADGFQRWEDSIRDGLRAMHARGDLPAEANPDRLALAILTALQGGLLLTQIRRETSPLEVALDTMLDHISLLKSLGAAGHAGAGPEQHVANSGGRHLGEQDLSAGAGGVELRRKSSSETLHH